MGADPMLEIWLMGWVGIVVLIVYQRSKKNALSVGLVSAFVLVFSIEHWFGALIYDFPWYFSNKYDIITLGFVHGLYALMAFGFGSLIVAPFLIKNFRFSWLKTKSYIPNPNLPKVYLITGFTFYFILAPILRNIISFRTLVYSGWYLLVVGICLGCWNLWCLKRKRELIYWLIFAGIAPFFTMITDGFLGAGTMSLLSILCFVAVFYRPRWRVILGTLASIYLGFSLFVNYMEYRGELRGMLWGEEKRPVSERIKVTYKMFKNFKLINLHNQQHLQYIDARLNQNYLIGMTIRYMESGSEPYAAGETIMQSVAAMIPRIIWQEKPFKLGGAELVGKYTGIPYSSDSVSIAMGLVMEFYINFGTSGIIIGFLLLGTAVTIIDIACGYRLIEGDWQSLTYLFLPVLCLVGCTSLVQIMMTMSSAVVFCIIVNKFILPRIGKVGVKKIKH